MSEKKPAGGSSSFSFTSQLFGANDSSSSSSNDIFRSIFSSNSLEGSQHSEVGDKSQALSSYPKSECNSKYKEQKNQSTSSREMSSFYQEQRTHPCHFSSSIYYGGQDVYTQNPGTTGLNSSLKKDGGEDDSGGASRGNWWQGSLYY